MLLSVDGFAAVSIGSGYQVQRSAQMMPGARLFGGKNLDGQSSLACFLAQEVAHP
jgi:hypothetical protein